MVWNHRFYVGRVVECYYDSAGKPDSYCENRFVYWFDSQASETLKTQYRKETQPNIYIPGLVPKGFTEVLGDEPRVIPPSFEGSFREFSIQQWLETQKLISSAIECAIAYEEAGYPPLEEEFQKPLTQRTICPGLKWAKLGGKYNENLVTKILSESKDLGVDLEFEVVLLRKETPKILVFLYHPKEMETSLVWAVMDLVLKHPNYWGKSLKYAPPKDGFDILNINLVFEPSIKW